MNVGHNEYCWELGISLTYDHYCHEVDCPYAAKCLTAPPKKETGKGTAPISTYMYAK